ncbi:MAG: response regulator transcription factor [Aquimonas sp.]|nr:response regulator transcription factor [Aquimonas sp.]
MTTIALVDDHAIVRQGFRRLLEREPDLRVVAEAASETQALAEIQRHTADLVVTDLSLSEGSGMGLLRALAGIQPRPLALVLSMHEGAAFVAEAFGLGARAYVTKASGADELVAAIRAVLRGKTYLSLDLRAEAGGLPEKPAMHLTRREREVLGLLLKGMVPKAAAAAIGINEKTLYAHRASLMAKLGVRNERELAVAAIESGLL